MFNSDRKDNSVLDTHEISVMKQRIQDTDVWFIKLRYDVCENVCKLYDITKNEDQCPHCGSKRSKQANTNSALVLVNTMKMMSFGDQLAELLRNSDTRRKLHYRANRQSVSKRLSDYFDGEEYTDEYLIQLAIIPRKPVDFDSFLQPIIDEVFSLGKYGLIMNKFDGEKISAKVHMVMASGDILQVSKFCHHKGHLSTYGCRVCEIIGGSPITGIQALNIFAKLPTFNGSSFYGLDEIRLIGQTITLQLGINFYKMKSTKNLSLSAFSPVNLYLTHIGYMSRKAENLKVYSTRSMKRTIGRYSKLIKSKVFAGKNAGNFVKKTCDAWLFKLCTRYSAAFRYHQAKPNFYR
ncbi:MAG: hypothetical protein EXX96DRAFT_534203 [Benjaminiella poitrasii]|nr:MAG: hypothetical protein EXX96DRAFT_534203 [Benjaminiella poitrasii]